MADVIHRATGQLLRSVNTPDYPEGEWVINPRLPDTGAPRDWIVEGDTVRLKTDAEQAEAQAEREAEAREGARREAQGLLENGSGASVAMKALALVILEELDAIKASTPLPQTGIDELLRRASELVKAGTADVV